MDENQPTNPQVEQQIIAAGSTYVLGAEEVARSQGRNLGLKGVVSVALLAIMVILSVILLRGCNSNNQSVSSAAPQLPPAVEPSPTDASTTTEAATTTTTTTLADTTTTATSTDGNGAFETAATYHDQSLGQIVPDLQYSGLLVYCAEASAIDAQYVSDLHDATFPAAAQPAIDELIAATTAKQAIEDQCAASSAQDADRLWSQQSTVDALQAAIAAEVAARAALGLPPAPAN